MRESKIEKYLTDQAKLNGFLCYKFVSPSNNGVPDRIIIGNGETVFIELKASGKKPRKLQQFIHEQMRQRGAKVVVLDNLDDVDRLIGNIKHQNLT